MITPHTEQMIDEIDERWHTARSERIHALTPGMLAALTARVARGESIGDADVETAVETMLGTADAEAFALLEAEDAAAEAAAGGRPVPPPRAPEVFDLFELEVARAPAP